MVTALLAAHGIDAVPEDDLDILAGLLPSIGGRMARLWAIDCGDGGPMLLGMRAVAASNQGSETP